MEKDIAIAVKTQYEALQRIPVNREDEDAVFDRLYFFFVVKSGYAKQAKAILGDGSYTAILERYQQELEEALLYLKQQRKKLHRSIFQRSQTLFHYLGLCYLKFLEGKAVEVDLHADEIAFLNQVLGYSYIYDYMVTFWGRKLRLPMEGVKMEPKTEEEIGYVNTHFFLTGTDYLTHSMTEENEAALKQQIPYVLEKQQMDLMAELLWGLSFYRSDAPELELMVEALLQEAKHPNYSKTRTSIHARYASICALLAVQERMDDTDSQRGMDISNRGSCRSAS